MARLEYFVVCRSVSADIDTDELTLCNVLEDLFLEDGTLVLPSIVAVSTWQIAPEELKSDFQAMLLITLPGEQTPQRFPMNLATGRRRYRALQRVIEIPLDKPGDLKFEVHLNGQHSASHVATVHPSSVRETTEASQMLATAEQANR